MDAKAQFPPRATPPQQHHHELDPAPQPQHPSYGFTPATSILSAEASALYPPIGQMLLGPRPLPPGHAYYPASDMGEGW